MKGTLADDDMTFLGIDLGTSGLRAVLVDEDGETIGAAQRSFTVAHPHPRWAEQAPSAWIAALEDAVAELRAAFPRFSDLRGIGVSGHMHGATLLDAAGEVLRPCILWNDTRAHAEAAMLDNMPEVRALSGNIVFPGFTAPKLLWLRENEPEVFDKVAKVLLPAGFMNFFLTGDYVADMSDSAGTSWLDVGQRCWSKTLLEAGGMRPDQMPRLVEGSEAAGQLRPALLQKWGLSQPVTVAGGAGDNAATACGIAAIEEGQGLVSLGTSGVLLAARNGYQPAPETALHSFCHAVPDRWYQMGVMLAATDSLNWLSRITGESPANLTSALGEDLKRPSGVRFLPYLSGERTPHNDADIRGSFTGLSTAKSRKDLTQSVLEGVAFGLRDSLEALITTGVSFDRLLATGGGTASRYWLRLIATVFDVPLALPVGGDFGAAVGAARLGMIAATGADPDSILRAPEIRETIDPVPALRSACDDAYKAFRASYPAIKAVQ